MDSSVFKFVSVAKPQLFEKHRWWASEAHPPLSTRQFTLSMRQTSEQETSQVLLAGAQELFLTDVKFSPHLTFDLAQNEWNNRDRL